MKRLFIVRYARWLPALILLVASCGTSRQQPESQPSVLRLPQPPAIASGKPFTFVVVGDNRGESSGLASPYFSKIVQEIKQVAPDFVLNTGDMINGYAGEDEAHLRTLWQGYEKAIAPLKTPWFHIPGNHDLFDATSARVWQELLGPAHYTFDCGDALFIALDTETERGRLGETQYEWLRGKLAAARNRKVFVFLHQPLFPVDGHIGSSLDQFPKERDRLHQLFVQ